jgi:uncharacterized protein
MWNSCFDQHSGWRQAKRKAWRGVFLGGLILGGCLFATTASVMVSAGTDATQSAQRVPAGEPGRSVNQLAQEVSPYLQEAARQPVHWLPWGEPAFRQAREGDKPILLDIGAIWCHWCHVMEKESYENPEVARLINEHFAAIKVDRDERPDVDRRYQQAVAMISGTGGWPLTVFLTPEGKVIYGGTYFPADDRDGRVGLKTLLLRVAAAYKSREAEVLKGTEMLAQALKRLESEASQRAPLSARLVDLVVSDLVQQFDPVHGGFGSEAKFPTGSRIELAMARYFVDRNPKMLEIATKTLDAMILGGIYDQLGGGVFRYSTDPQWKIPHFEKMNYDNAEFLVNLVHAYQATGKEHYRTAAYETMHYLNTTLSDQRHGGFYAHQDADMGRADDGDYYTWTVQEVRKALASEEAEVLLRYYDVQPIGEMEGNRTKNVLRVAMSPEAIARERGLSSETVRRLIASGRLRLLRARMKRQTPLVDKTIYTDRNGMLIAAYLEASQVLGSHEAKAFALRTLDRVLQLAYRQGQGMYHASIDGAARLPGLLNDQVHMAFALVAAFEATGEQRYLKIARDLMDFAIKVLWDLKDGAFLDRPREELALPALERTVKDFEDDPTASPEAVAVLVLDRLTYLTNDEHYRAKATQTLEAFANSLKEAGTFAAAYALAVQYHLSPSAQAVIIGEKDDPATAALWQAALTAYRPGKLVAVYDPTALNLEALPPAVAGAVKVYGVQGKPRAYVCAGATCAPPTDNHDEVVALVQAYGLP